MLEEWLLAASATWWVYPALFAVVLGDALLVVLPGETAVVALAAIGASTGTPDILAVAAIAATAAIAGDSATYALGRAVGAERWRWQRKPRVARAIARAQRGIHRRAALLIMTARYVPYARIAVNLTAGATGFAYPRFLALSSLAGVTWAAYNCAVGALFGVALGGDPLLAVTLSVVCAMVFGFTIDRAVLVVSRRRSPRDDQHSAVTRD